MPRITEDLTPGGSGQQEVTDSAVSVGVSENAKAVQFQADPDNAGNIDLGTSSDLTVGTGIVLAPGRETGILPGKPGDYFVIGPGNSEVIRYMYWT